MGAQNIAEQTWLRRHMQSEFFQLEHSQALNAIADTIVEPFNFRVGLRQISVALCEVSKVDDQILVGADQNHGSASRISRNRIHPKIKIIPSFALELVQQLLHVEYHRVN